MENRVPRKYAVFGLVLTLIISAFASGCSLFGPRNKPRTPATRPSPTRPMAPTGRQTRTPLRPAPTKSLPGVSSTDATQLRSTTDRIMSAVSKNDWAAATRDTNKLGALWTRFKPSSKGTMSATEMKNFDANYAKLQKDVRAKNKSGAERDCRAIRDTVTKIRR